MTDDLSDNDIVIRQINCAHILCRNLWQKLACGASASSDITTNFNIDFYGDEHFWTRYGRTMRIVLFLFPVLHVIQVCILDFLLLLVGRLPVLSSANLIIQMKKKRQAYRKTRVYFEKLIEPVELHTQSEGF